MKTSHQSIEALKTFTRRRFSHLCCLLLPLLLGAAGWLAAPLPVHAADPPAPAISAVEKLDPTQAVFKDAIRGKPLVIKSAEDAVKYFTAEDLAELKKKTDFKEQTLLIFAWRGSGGDKLIYAVAESFPEQISFTIQRGMTKDLREHTQLYLLRSNVSWSVK